MKNIIKTITRITTSIMLLFITSTHAQPIKNQRAKLLKKKIYQLNELIGKKTRNKALLQRERDKLLRQSKELSPTKKPNGANNPPIVATPKG